MTLPLAQLRAITQRLRDQRASRTGQHIIRTDGEHDIVIDYDAPADAPATLIACETIDKQAKST